MPHPPSENEFDTPAINRKFVGLNPGKGIYLGCGFGTLVGAHTRGSQLMFLSPHFHPLSPKSMSMSLGED